MSGRCTWRLLLLLLFLRLRLLLLGLSRQRLSQMGDEVVSLVAITSMTVESIGLFRWPISFSGGTQEGKTLQR